MKSVEEYCNQLRADIDVLRGHYDDFLEDYPIDLAVCLQSTTFEDDIACLEHAMLTRELVKKKSK